MVQARKGDPESAILSRCNPLKLQRVSPAIRCTHHLWIACKSLHQGHGIHKRAQLSRRIHTQRTEESWSGQVRRPPRRIAVRVNVAFNCI